MARLPPRLRTIISGAIVVSAATAAPSRSRSANVIPPDLNRDHTMQTPKDIAHTMVYAPRVPVCRTVRG